MGQTCYQYINTITSQLEVSEVEDLIPCEVPDHQPFIEEWIAKNIPEENRPRLQLYKHKQKEVYYYSVETSPFLRGQCFVYRPGVLFFDGYCENGLPYGMAVVKMLDKSCVYEGNVKEWVSHGSGTLYDHKNKYKLTGYWDESKPVAGMITFDDDPNVSSIEITKFDAPRGTISYRDNRWYEGEIILKFLLPHGQGKVTFPFGSNRKSYEGKWYMGQMNGQGRYDYSNQTIYVGEFCVGHKQGFGKLTFASGSYYEGFWKKGKKNGPAASYSSSLGSRYGIWVQGVLSRQLTQQEFQVELKKAYEQQQKSVLAESSASRMSENLSLSKYINNRVETEK